MEQTVTKNFKVSDLLALTGEGTLNMLQSGH